MAATAFGLMSYVGQFPQSNSSAYQADVLQPSKLAEKIRKRELRQEQNLIRFFEVVEKIRNQRPEWNAELKNVRNILEFENMIDNIVEQEYNPSAEDPDVLVAAIEILEGNGSWSYCSPATPCGVGEGDCDYAAECQTGLNCVKDSGADYGFASHIDICQ